MSEHRWQGYSHQELYDQINQGPGAEGSTDSIRRWTELTRALGEIDTGLAMALARAMGDWEGDAADSARNGIRPLGEWAIQAQQAAEIMRRRAEEQAEHVGKARTDMPPPVNVTAEDPGFVSSMLVHLFGGQTDYEQQEAKKDAAEQRAFEVMRTYEASTKANTTSLASFSAPPQVVVDAPPAGSSGGSAAQRGITLSWATPPPPPLAVHVPSQLSADRRGMPISGYSSYSSSGRGTSTRTSTSGGATSVTRSRRGRDNTEQIDSLVTEQAGGAGGFFDEPRTFARPVIGGEQPG